MEFKSKTTPRMDNVFNSFVIILCLIFVTTKMSKKRTIYTAKTVFINI